MSSRYDAIIAMKPEDRTSGSGDVLKDRIIGILIAFGQKFQDNNGFMDTTTVSDAVNEIYDLLIDVKYNKYENL